MVDGVIGWLIMPQTAWFLDAKTMIFLANGEMSTQLQSDRVAFLL
jgi:hypothetical protein